MNQLNPNAQAFKPVKKNNDPFTLSIGAPAFVPQ